MFVQIDDSSCDEPHEGVGTGLALVTEEVLAEASRILEPSEPYYELHEGTGTGMDLDPAKVIRQARAIVLESWQREQVRARQEETYAESLKE